MTLDWAARQTRHDAVIFEGMRWGRRDLGLLSLKSSVLATAMNLWLGWMDALLEECSARQQSQEQLPHFSKQRLSEQQEKIFPNRC